MVRRLFKRGSVQLGCILRGLRFQSTTIRFFFTTIRFFKFLLAGFARETADKQLDLKSLNRQTKAKELLLIFYLLFIIRSSKLA